MKLHFETPRLVVYDAVEEEIPKIIEMEEAIENRNFVFQGSYEDHLSETRSDNTLLLSIKKKNSGEMIGFCLSVIDNKNKSFEFRRIVINPKGLGYGKEFILGLLKYSFIDLNMNRFWLDVFEDNTVGISLYTSLGLVHEGTLRQSYKDEKGYRNQLIFSMLRDEFFAKHM
ncbi:MAG: GNAT family N-acetyltransferase [Tissierellia bacterium]|nr:GNAT family N-acetyltransferase [Tissierellia bacterium]